MLPARQAVDDRYAELTSAGYRGRQSPFDAFWGARDAIVADPDGNDVGLMSPAEDSRPSSPRACRLGSVGRHAAGRIRRRIPLLACPDASRPGNAALPRS
jgi:hypothetical protein